MKTILIDVTVAKVKLMLHIHSVGNNEGEGVEGEGVMGVN